MFKEPKITINDKLLSDGEAMTIRVAVESFAHDLISNGLGNDDTGKAICRGYLTNINKIRNIWHKY